jgi:Sporulation and spore germination
VSRLLKFAIGILVVFVLIGLLALPSLRQTVNRLSGTSRTEEQARREVMEPGLSTPTDVKANAQIYWLSPTSPNTLAATPMELPLSADPVERAKQLLNALVANVPSPALRTLPADTALLAFYLQPDGTAVADFSDDLSLKTPSGILSEQLAVDSILQTLGANGTAIKQLKILIHGQEAETLAGHVDITDVFAVPLPSPAIITGADGPVPPGPPSPKAITGPTSPPAVVPAPAKQKP